jgi:DMSO/TMAO reductase YedYZ molybdopterin-dependent catalytic subunit
MSKIERTVGEVYQDDPERADAVIFGRRTDVSRRGFLGGSGMAAMSAAVGGPIVFGAPMPGGLIPAALAQEAKTDPSAEAPEHKGTQLLQFPGKDGNLILLGDKPLAAETPEHLLDDETTPTSKFFVSNNGQVPEATKEPDAWKLTVDGEVNKMLELTLGELKSKVRPVTRRMVLECGGNGRSFFIPQARGNQWTNGGAGCAEWTGARLADVIRAAGPKPSAAFSGHYGADPHLSGDTTKSALSRGVPIKKLMDESNLIAWEMNGKPLEPIHGFPVRLIIPGWPGSVSAKWLTRIWLRDKPHDGQGMGGTSYRLAVKPMLPGSKTDEKNFKDLESMPVRAIITKPANGTRLGAKVRDLGLRGAAWAGDYTVRAVDVSMDFGASWQRADLSQAKNRYDWQRWTATLKLPSEGYYEIWSRATDSRGIMQPHVAGNWNPQGYGANPMHRIAILVG